MIRAVLFDLDGTLLDIAAARARFAAAAGAGGPVETGGPAADFCGRLAEGLGECPVRTLVGYRRRIAEFVEPAAGLEAVLDRLAGRFALGVVSNGSASVQRAKAARVLGERAGLMGVVLTSGEFGRAKPHPSIFAAAARRLGVDAAEALFVGDDPVTDVTGGAGAGMRTCLIGPAAGVCGAARPDFRVGAVSGVPGVVGC